MTEPVTVPGAGQPPNPTQEIWPLRLPVVLIVAGLIGLAASFVLTVEKFRLIEDPFYTPSCSVNAVLSCGSVMASEQSQAFGFPNSLLGLVGFAALTVAGAAMNAGATPRRWFNAGLQVGVSAGALFVHWLIWQTVFSIGALCPYCMVVWVSTMTAFFYVTLVNLGRSRFAGSRWVQAGTRWHSSLLAVWLFVVAGVAFVGLP